MRAVFFGSTALAAALAGCFGAGDGTMLGATGTTPSDDGGTSTATNGADGSVAGPADLPCDVQQLLATHCTSCHSDPPVSGPMGLVTYADLSAPSKSDPSKSVAELSLSRMQSSTTPMPPSPAARVSAAEIAAFQAWVSSGAPQGSCATTTSPVPGIYDTPVTCTSNTTWAQGNRGSSRMHPGGTCIQCHSSGEGPSFSIAGTAYPSAHEPNDCNGKSGATVTIVDAAGKQFTLTTNAAGNFYDTGITLTLPYHAKVSANGKERAMSAAQTSGDCNSCHTESGANGAPGRITQESRSHDAPRAIE